MPIYPPPEVAAVLASFDARADAFRTSDVVSAIERAIQNPRALGAEARRGLWAETSAFAFDVQDDVEGPPWQTYFRPWTTGTNGDGSPYFGPDLNEVDGDTLDYWADRSITVKHPVLAARYADLVWDTAEYVTKAKRDRDKVEYAFRAIDNYLAASQRDSGSAWGDTRENLGRALKLSLRLRNAPRIVASVKATIEYVERTAKDDHIGTYCYLFDNLLPTDDGPELTEEQQRTIIEMFEAKFAVMTTPGGPWDVEPHSPRDVGLRLADYYKRTGRPQDRVRILKAIGQQFERRAKMGEPMVGIMFLQEALGYFTHAGLQEDAKRVQHEAQKMGPAAEAGLVPMGVEFEAPTPDTNQVLDALMAGGLHRALLDFGLNFVPDQAAIKALKEQLAKDYPLYAMFSDSAKILGHGHIEADIGDDRGDPDGKLVFDTARHIQLNAHWITLVFNRMASEGLTPAQLVEFLRPCPLFTEDRLPLIRRGIEAHFNGDYVQAVHFLVPQLERAVVSILLLAGKPSNKPHRTGRGVMQYKSMNNVLTTEEWPFKEERGENLRLYLLTTLAHPKGLNIRNDVCHGLWSTQHFTRTASEILLHVTLALSMLRPARSQEGNHAGPTTSPPS